MNLGLPAGGGGGISLKVSRNSTFLAAYSLLKQEQLQLAQASFCDNFIPPSFKAIVRQIRRAFLFVKKNCFLTLQISNRQTKGSQPVSQAPTHLNDELGH